MRSSSNGRGPTTANTQADRSSGKPPSTTPTHTTSLRSTAGAGQRSSTTTTAIGNTTAVKKDAAPPSRRAQGWHTAVDGAGAGPRTTSILSSDTGSTGRRLSVQFSADTPADTPSARAHHREEVGFQQSMADFLGVMYGGKGDGASAGAHPVGGAKAGGHTATTTAATTGPSTSPPRARAKMYSSAATSPQVLPPSPTATDARKGPQVRGRTTTTTAGAAAVPTSVPVGPGGVSGRQASRLGAARGADSIDMLVDHLVRAYSSRVGANGENGRGLSMDDGAEAPISYNGGGAGSGRRGPVTGRRRASDAHEVSTFVSQALDSFLGPPSGRGANQLTSTKSILSSLGLDENFANLLSFRTRSDLPAGGDGLEGESATQLQPVYIGEQAMFRSVGSRPADVSVSKSMSVMRGVVPLVAEGGSSQPVTRRSADGLHRQAAAAAGSSPSHGNAGNAPRGVTGPQAGRRTAAAAAPSSTMNRDKSFTLDSRALPAADDADDSWGDVDAEAATLAKREKEKERLRGGAAAKAGTTAVGNSPARVNNTRSLLEMAKDRNAVQDLLEEETLSRNVVAALEQQLRTYIVSTSKEMRGAPSVRGRRRSNGAAPVASSVPTALRK